MAPGCELGVWVDLGQRGLPMGLGNRLAAKLGPTRFAHIPTVGEADHGNMENRLLRV